MTPKALKKILETHADYLKTGDQSKRAYLTGANLYGANLKDANLTGANLTRANLTGANLTGANLKDAYLYGANLTGAYLTGANLEGANLYGADLTGVHLERANLGVRHPLARMLRLLGACDASLQWIETRAGDSIETLIAAAREENPDWISWAVRAGVIES